MTTEPDDVTNEDLDLLPDVEDIGQGEIQFTPTGIRHKDMAIAAMINTAPKACKELIYNHAWDGVVASPNPAGKAELELLRILKVPEDCLKIVLVKLKTLLMGYNMSIPQAFHNCVIEDQIKRIKLDNLQPKVEEVQVPVPEAVPVVQEVTSQLVGSVLTHTDGTVYTFGTRGRRPLWVLEWLKTNQEPVVEKDTTPKCILKGSKLISPEGDKYKFGTRGRRPLWVLEWLKTNPEPTA